jgi:type IX secretion system PorP/SprF family membrane protein
MKTIQNIAGLIGFLFLSLSLQAQDIHFSQYNESKLLLNPANAGFFKGQWRFNANYRNQWNNRFINNNGVGSNNSGYVTLAASYDISLRASKTSLDKVGVAVQFYNDKAGEVALSTTYGTVGLSYWKTLQNFKDKYFVAGFLVGFIDRKIDYSNLQLPDQYDHFNPHSALPATSFPVNNRTISAEISFGIKYFEAVNKRKFFQYGIAMYHINRPKTSFFFDKTTDRTYRKIVASGGMKYPLASKVDILPSLMIAFQGPAYEFNEGAFFRFQITENRAKELMAYNIGMWFRQSRSVQGVVFDALAIVTKLEFNQYTFGFSYDVNTSALKTSTRLKGGPELSFSYVGITDAGLGNRKRPVCPVF